MDPFDNSSEFIPSSHPSKGKCWSSPSEASLLPPRPRPSPCASFQPLQDALCKKVQVPPCWPYGCSLSLSPWLPHPQTKGAEQMARVLPQCLPSALGEESGRGSEHSEQAALTPTTGCFPEAAPLLPNPASPPRSSGRCASIQPHLVCTSTAAGRGEVAFSGRFSGSGNATWLVSQVPGSLCPNGICRCGDDHGKPGSWGAVCFLGIAQVCRFCVSWWNCEGGHESNGCSSTPKLDHPEAVPRSLSPICQTSEGTVTCCFEWL